MTSYWWSAVLWLAPSSRLGDAHLDTCKKDAAHSEKENTSAKRSEVAYTSPQSAAGSSSTRAAYAPVVVLPGVVNSSFMLLSPGLSHNATMRRRTRSSDKRRRGAMSESEVLPLRTFESRSSRTSKENCTLSRRASYAIGHVHDSVSSSSYNAG